MTGEWIDRPPKNKRPKIKLAPKGAALRQRILENEEQQLRKITGFSAVYAIGPSRDGPLKIGRGEDVESRLTQIQIGHWLELDVLAVRWMSYGGSMRIEKAMHGFFKTKEKHLRGEWFSVNTDEWSEAIDDLMTRHDVKLHRSWNATEAPNCPTQP